MTRLKKILAALAAIAAGTAVLTYETKEASELLCEAEPALCHRLRCINPDIPVTVYKQEAGFCRLMGDQWLMGEAPCEPTGTPWPQTVFAGERPERVAAEDNAECLASLQYWLKGYQNDPERARLLADTLAEIEAAK